MNRVRPRPVVLLAFILVWAIAPAAATAEATGDFDVSQLAGIEAGVARSWSVDFEARAAEATPTEEFDIFAGAEGLLFLFGWVLAFDDASNAEAAFARLRDEGVGLFLSEFESDPEATIAEAALDDLGNQAYQFDLSSTAEEDVGYFRLAFAQEDAFILFGIGLSTTEAGVAGANSLLGYLVEDGEKSDEDDTFDAAGGSTGGLWGFFPDDDEPFLAGLIPASDEILYPVPEEDAT
jgi:hypothetical protein